VYQRYVIVAQCNLFVPLMPSLSTSRAPRSCRDRAGAGHAGAHSTSKVHRTHPFTSVSCECHKICVVNLALRGQSFLVDAVETVFDIFFQGWGELIGVCYLGQTPYGSVDVFAVRVVVRDESVQNVQHLHLIGARHPRDLFLALARPLCKGKLSYDGLRHLYDCLFEKKIAVTAVRVSFKKIARLG